MALKKPTFEQEPAAAHSDTNQGDTAVAEKPAARQEVKQEKPAEVKQEVRQEPAAAATTAIAKASASSVATADAAARAKAFQREFEEMKDASDFSYGNYKVFKGNNGSIAETGDKGIDLGRWVQVRLMAWGKHFEISPGESGASTKEFVGYSKDGKTIDSVIGEDVKSWEGRSVDDYIKYLREEEEFAGAKVREFVDMACALMACDAGDVPLKMIQLTLSETSIPSFSRYQQELKDTARCCAMGLPGFTLPDDPFNFFVIREVASKGSQRWTKLMISSELPAKL